LDKFSADKLDNLFREKLTDMEIPLEEDYWPGIEKGLGKLPFYKFGWKHLNIYNVSASLLALLITFTLLLNNNTGKGKSKFQRPVININTFQHSAKDLDEKNEPTAQETKIIEVNQPKSILKAPITMDTIAPPKIEAPVVLPEPEKPIVEEKPKQKQKKIIYVVQQDTIIQKDTIKVRRKRKN